MPRKIGIGSWAYTFGPYQKKPISLNVVAERLRKLGFDGIELCGSRPHAHPDDYPTKQNRQKLVDLMDKNGLEICGFSPACSQYSPASNDHSVREAYKRCFEKNLKFCEDCEISIIRVDTASPPPLIPGVEYNVAWNRIVDVFRRCAQKAADAGVLVVWEFEPGTMFNKPSEIIKLVENIDHPNFKVLFDTCHAQMCAAIGARQAEPKETLQGGVIELAKMLTGKIGHVHLIDSDNTLHDNMTSTHAPFGQGVLDFDKVIPSILEAEYSSDWWTIDLCFWPKAWEVTTQAKKFVDKLIRKYG